MKKLLLLLCASFSFLTIGKAQNARIEINPSFNYYSGDIDDPYQFFVIGLRAEKLFSKRFGWIVSTDYGHDNTEIYIDNIFIEGRSAFVGFEPAVAFHSGQNMKGFTAEFALRTSMEFARAEAPVQNVKLRESYFNIGPQATIGFNTVFSGNWMMGARVGIGVLVGDYSYTRLLGGLTISRFF